MAGVTMLYKKQKTSIGSVELDASVSEQHTGAVEVTDHPVETGGAISDHARPLPETVTIEGLISNTPMPEAGAATQERTWAGVNYRSSSEMAPTNASEGYAALLKLKDAGELITVVTALRTYENMVLTSLTVPRDARTGNGLRFAASLKQVRVANSQTVQVLTTEDKTKKKKVENKKAAPETPEVDASTLWHLDLVEKAKAGARILGL